MNVRLIHDDMPSYMNDVQEVVRAFAPHIVVSDVAEDFIAVSVSEAEYGVTLDIRSSLADEFNSFYDYPEGDVLAVRRVIKSFVKGALYSYCNRITGIDLPYGSLTGVRPTAVYYRAIGSYSNIISHLINDYNVEPRRAELIEKVVDGQSSVYNFAGEGADVFVNIPICPTRCKYCSFISTEYARVKKLIPAYVEAVCAELDAIGERIARENLKVRSVYYGGGTPTSLAPDELDKLLKLTRYGGEFTVEAGRPDSITQDKLDVLAANGVTRISVNPQTLKEDTLAAIGRRHTVEDFFRAYELARKYSFDVNVDLIAGLEGESFEDFKGTLDRIIELSPENVTVHSLSIKRGAVLRDEGAVKSMDGVVKAMTDYTMDALGAADYIPYYMYRQKNTADGLENVGYCKVGKQCVYNVDYMEETNTVLSAGAGAVTKFVYRSEGRIERRANAKGFEEYLRRAGKIK